MRNRVIGAVLGVAFGASVTLGGYLYATGALPATTSAADDRSIPVSVYQTTSSSKTGDHCSLLKDTTRFTALPRQIIIRDESNKVIAKQSLVEGRVEDSIVGSPICKMSFSIDPPESTFYAVFLDNEMVMIFRSDDFPIDSTETVTINLG